MSSIVRVKEDFCIQSTNHPLQRMSKEQTISTMSIHFGDQSDLPNVDEIDEHWECKEDEIDDVDDILGMVLKFVY